MVTTTSGKPRFLFEENETSRDRAWLLSFIAIIIIEVVYIVLKSYSSQILRQRGQLLYITAPACVATFPVNANVSARACSFISPRDERCFSCRCRGWTSLLAISTGRPRPPTVVSHADSAREGSLATDTFNLYDAKLERTRGRRRRLDSRVLNSLKSPDQSRFQCFIANLFGCSFENELQVKVVSNLYSFFFS